MGPFRAARMPARLLTAGSAVAGAAIVVGASVANADSGPVVLNAAPQTVEVRATLLAETAKHEESIDDLRAATVEARLALSSAAGVLGDDAEAMLATRAALEDAIATIVAASGLGLVDRPVAESDVRILTGDYTVSSLGLGLAKADLLQSIDALDAAVYAALLGQAVEAYDAAVKAASAAATSGQKTLDATRDKVTDNEPRKDLRAALEEFASLVDADLDKGDLDAVNGATEKVQDAARAIKDAQTAVGKVHQAWKDEEAAKAAAAAAAAAKATSYGSSGGSTYSGSSGSTSSGSSGSSGSSSGSSSSGSTSTISASGNAYTLCAEINSARAANGVPKLRSCYQSSTRQAHANRMASAGTIWHESAPEIVGMAGSVSQMMWASGGYGFMSSAGHRNIILTKGYTTASVACATGSPYVYCVAVFG